MSKVIGRQPDINLNSPDVADIASQPGFDANPLDLVDASLDTETDADFTEDESDAPPRSDDDDADRFPASPAK